MKRLVRLLLFFFTVAPGGAVWAQLPPAADSPVTARQSLRHFDLAPGMRIEVAAAAPQVRMNHVSLDRSRADDGHLDYQIVKTNTIS